MRRISIGESHDFKQESLLLNPSPSVLHGEGNISSTNLYENKTFKRKSAKVFEGIPYNKKASMELMRDRAIKRLKEHSTDYRLLPEISMP